MPRFLVVPTVLALSLCAVAVIEGAKVKTRAEFDKTFSFRELKTWAWDPAEAGNVIMARTADDDPVPVKARVDPLITAAVARELGARGLNPATDGPPDLTMHYYLLVTVGSEAQVMGQFLPAVSDWGVPPFTAGTQSLSVITRGSLVLDALSPKLGRVVWRGVAQTDLDFAPSAAQRETIIREAVRDLVKRLPLKK